MNGLPTAGPDGPRADIPSLSRRVVIGALRLLPLLFVWVFLPYGALRGLDSVGVATSLSVTTIVVVGAILSVLSTVRYIVKPTRAFGPVGALGSGIAAGYLLLLAQSAEFTISGPNGIGISIEYGTVLELLAIVPLFGLAAALVTTAEDISRPGERLPFDYPVR
ncbi:MAG TPA: hypothetical protein VEY07_01610 [Thermoplasmata archaeon]|nr:hypothetical protein [Thermoplasmata archaeon]